MTTDFAALACYRHSQIKKRPSLGCDECAHLSRVVQEQLVAQHDRMHAQLTGEMDRLVQNLKLERDQLKALYADAANAINIYKNGLRTLTTARDQLEARLDVITAAQDKLQEVAREVLALKCWNRITDNAAFDAYNRLSALVTPPEVPNA